MSNRHKNIYTTLFNLRHCYYQIVGNGNEIAPVLAGLSPTSQRNHRLFAANVHKLMRFSLGRYDSRLIVITFQLFFITSRFVSVESRLQFYFLLQRSLCVDTKNDKRKMDAFKLESVWRSLSLECSSLCFVEIEILLLVYLFSFTLFIS